MRKRYVVMLVWAVLIFGCSESENCVCVIETVDPAISDVSITWIDGNIWADLGPNIPPDRIMCNIWLEFKNRNTRKEFKYVHIRRVDVILAENDSTLGSFPVETYWWGYLAPDARARAFYVKSRGDQKLFDPPCSQPVLIRFTVSNAEGDTMVFEPDTLTFDCVF